MNKLVQWLLRVQSIPLTRKALEFYLTIDKDNDKSMKSGVFWAGFSVWIIQSNIFDAQLLTINTCSW